MRQYYIENNRPASNSAKDLFEYCVGIVRDKDLFSTSYMHNQWAAVLFGYEKRSMERTDLMSKVKREYSTYFGDVEMTSRMMTPSCSSSLSWRVRILGEIPGILAMSWLKRRGEPSRASLPTMGVFQRPSMADMAISMP